METFFEAERPTEKLSLRHPHRSRITGAGFCHRGNKWKFRVTRSDEHKHRRIKKASRSYLENVDSVYFGICGDCWRRQTPSEFHLLRFLSVVTGSNPSSRNLFSVMMIINDHDDVIMVWCWSPLAQVCAVLSFTEFHRVSPCHFPHRRRICRMDTAPKFRSLRSERPTGAAQ